MENDTKDAVKQLAIELRARHGALDWEATVDDLIDLEGLRQSEFDLQNKTLLEQLKVRIDNAICSIKALIHVPNKLIAVDSNLHHSKKHFGKAHELGHNTIPWHREILYTCSEYDLSADVRDEMEKEANAFGGVLLIPTPLLQKHYNTFPTSIESILHVYELAQKKASIHTTAIRYVSECPSACCLLIFKNDRNDQVPPTPVCWPTYSRSWREQKLQWIDENQFIMKDAIAELVSGIQTGDIRSCPIEIEGRLTKVDLFSNSYNIFALIIP